LFDGTVLPYSLDFYQQHSEELLLIYRCKTPIYKKANLAVRKAIFAKAIKEYDLKVKDGADHFKFGLDFSPEVFDSYFLEILADFLNKVVTFHSNDEKFIELLRCTFLNRIKDCYYDLTSGAFNYNSFSILLALFNYKIFLVNLRPEKIAVFNNLYHLCDSKEENDFSVAKALYLINLIDIKGHSEKFALKWLIEYWRVTLAFGPSAFSYSHQYLSNLQTITDISCKVLHDGFYDVRFPDLPSYDILVEQILLKDIGVVTAMKSSNVSIFEFFKSLSSSDPNWKVEFKNYIQDQRNQKILQILKMYPTFHQLQFNSNIWYFGNLDSDFENLAELYGFLARSKTAAPDGKKVFTIDHKQLQLDNLDPAFKLYERNLKSKIDQFIASSPAHQDSAKVEEEIDRIYSKLLTPAPNKVDFFKKYIESLAWSQISRFLSK
jgi:hypothetical protein